MGFSDLVVKRIQLAGYAPVCSPLFLTTEAQRKMKAHWHLLVLEKIWFLEF